MSATTTTAAETKARAAGAGARRKRRRTKRDAVDQALQAAPVPVVVVDDAGFVSLCNDAAAALLGVARADVEGRGVEAYLAPVRVLDALTRDGARAVVPCDRNGGRSDGRASRVGVRAGRVPDRAAPGDRMLVLDDEGASTRASLPFDVVELLQMAALSRRSLVVDVAPADGGFGRIFVVDGMPWWAGDLTDEGAAAFHRLAFASGASVSCARLDRKPPARNLHGALEQLLLDAARMRDEERRATGDDAELVDDDDVVDALADDDDPWADAFADAFGEARTAA